MRARLVVLPLAVAVAAACGDDAPSGDPSTQAGDAGAEAATPLCVDGKPTAAYPPGPHDIAVSGVVPQGLSFDGPDGPIALDAFFEPCAPRSRVLVLRTSAAWCGPCRWHAEHTKRLLSDPRLAGRLVLVDLLVADEDNMPATVPNAAAFRARIDAPPELGAKIAVDPKYTFAGALLSRAPLPEYVFVDTRTMKILSTETDPAPEQLQSKLAIELAILDGTPRPEPIAPKRVDGLFAENEIDLIREMKLVSAAPPPDPTNEYGDVPAAAALGKTLFSDKLLSPSGNVSCATCHDAALDFTDGKAQSEGVAKVNRNAPALALAAHSRWQFWDGRADTLWMQALGPFEDDKEFGGSRLFVAQQIALRYAAEYAAVFGAKYPLDVAGVQALPPAGKPGQAAYDALPAPDKEKVTRIFVNVGKAIAAFERSLRVQPNALDRYADGDLAALTATQKEALSHFFKNGCAQCHWGPRLTDDAFHVIRFETGRQDGKADSGRFDVLPTLASAEFVATSTWSDAPSAAKLLALPQAPTMLGAFKTPTLRGLPTSGPYGHGGTQATLLDVSKHYGKRGLEHESSLAIGTTEQWVPEFDSHAQSLLPAFLEVLAGAAIVP